MTDTTNKEAPWGFSGNSRAHGRCDRCGHHGSDCRCSADQVRHHDRMLDDRNALNNSYGQGQFKDGQIREQVSKIDALIFADRAAAQQTEG